MLTALQYYLNLKVCTYKPQCLMDDILDLYIKAFTATMTCYSHELPSTKRLRLAF